MSQASVFRKEVNEKVEVWSRHGLAAGGRALAFMLNKMGSHSKALWGGGDKI